jgi:hypothetical protein
MRCQLQQCKIQLTASLNDLCVVALQRGVSAQSGTSIGSYGRAAGNSLILLGNTCSSDNDRECQNDLQSCYWDKTGSQTCLNPVWTRKTAKASLCRRGSTGLIYCFAKLWNAIKSPFIQANEVTNSAVYRLVLAFNIRVDEMHAVISVMC